MDHPKPEGPREIADAGRVLALAALALVLIPLLVEAAALDPALLASFHAPGFAALRLALSSAEPYLIVAASVGALAALASDGIGAAPRAWGWTLPATILATWVATGTPSFGEALLADRVSIDGDCARAGGELAGCAELAPVALEDAGALAKVALPAREEPWDAEVRWVGTRAAEVDPARRVELVAGGVARDVTGELTALRPGEARVFRHAVRVGPGAGSVHLRLADDPRPPSIFVDPRREQAGLAVIGGNGDDVRRVEPQAGPGALPVPTLRFEGEHREGGHIVLVFSGEQWGVHDLAALRDAGGDLELTLAGDPRWQVRLTANGAESTLVPLARFRAEADGPLTRHRIALGTLDLGAVPIGAVVGVALVWDGPVGPVSVDVAGIRATAERATGSGYQLATLAALDPGVRPAGAMFAAGMVPNLGLPARFGGPLRLGAALIAMVGLVGPRTIPRVLRARPLHAAAAIAVGPALAVGLEPALRAFTEPRLEQLPLCLGATALATAAAGLSTPRAARTRAVDRQVEAVRVWIGLSALFAVALHVSADSSGQPWLDHPVDSRRVPSLLHALTAGFEAPAFVLGVLYVVARQRRPWAATLRGTWRRLGPALLVGAAAFLLLRLGKATAFGYDAAYRHELAQGATWLRAVLLGEAQYHLYVLPVLLALTLLTPLFSPALTRPWLGLGLLGTLALWPALDRQVYAQVASPDVRAFALRGTMVLAFSGYGLLAYALAGLRPEARRAQLAIGLLGVLACTGLLAWSGWHGAEAGTWDVQPRAATWLLPAAAFAAVLALAPASWPAPLRWLASVGPGVYLVHPAVLDVLEILERGRGWSPLQTTALNFAVVAGVSILLVAIVGRTAWGRAALALEPR